MKSKATILADFLTASAIAFTAPAGAAPSTHLPAEHKAGPVAYLSGGASQREADAIKHVAEHYPLEMQFLRRAKPKDEYLADVHVRIKDERDMMVLNITSDGPFLLARLPAGKYTVTAEHNHDLQTRVIQIAAKEHRRVVFEWQS